MAQVQMLSASLGGGHFQKRFAAGKYNQRKGRVHLCQKAAHVCRPRSVRLDTRCGLFSRNNTESYEMGEASRSDVARIANFFVDAFFLDRVEDAPSQLRKNLINGQLADLRRRYTGRKSEAVLLCSRDVDGDVVGCVGMEVATFDGREQIAEGAYTENELELRPVVANLAVGQEQRRQGLARELMEECEAVAREWGYEEILLFVEDQNGRAKKLYGKLSPAVIPVAAFWRALPRAECGRRVRLCFNERQGVERQGAERQGVGISAFSSFPSFVWGEPQCFVEVPCSVRVAWDAQDKQREPSRVVVCACSAWRMPPLNLTGSQHQHGVLPYSASHNRKGLV
ncbi:hypothetical protein CYMTET_32759 [Cymbomonas tetramitiformis]|uniref:N-acetyltransferase domain-containing protein n=1 Tax=Cymbomonas tetramitiformis TaxID=36881 RepID=A0AAE0KRW1_9CHLO|nr:hypothetical protein CYMTET_32759 [Cymbomonas tetramitiformis]